MDMPQSAATWNRHWSTAVIVTVLAAAILGSLHAEKPLALKQHAAPTAKHGSLVAIADLHGDIDKAKKALQLLSIVDSEGRWLAEGITVVQVSLAKLSIMDSMTLNASNAA
jgi:hypothetical protein